MAITVEQERRPIDWAMIIGVSIFVIVIFAGVYYLFVVTPQTIEKLAKSDSQVTNLAGIKDFEYRSVLDQAAQYKNVFHEGIPAASQKGRSNPFQAQ